MWEQIRRRSSRKGSGERLLVDVKAGKRSESRQAAFDNQIHEHKAVFRRHRHVNSAFRLLHSSQAPGLIIRRLCKSEGVDRPLCFSPAYTELMAENWPKWAGGEKRRKSLSAECLLLFNSSWSQRSEGRTQDVCIHPDRHLERNRRNITLMHGFNSNKKKINQSSVLKRLCPLPNWSVFTANTHFLIAKYF